MKHFKKMAIAVIATMTLVTCRNDENQSTEKNDVTLQFKNTYENKEIILGNSPTNSTLLTVEKDGKKFYFSSIKYVISNIILISEDNKEFQYYTNNLDKGAFVVNQEKTESLKLKLLEIPKNKYKSIKFTLGIKPELNKLNEAEFPKFYQTAGANDTQMHWEWGNGYRFAKIEGGTESGATLSIHTGSTVKCPQGKTCEEKDYIQGVRADREITLNFPKSIEIGNNSADIFINADWNNLFNGVKKLDITEKVPEVHGANNMIPFVDNMAGMFSITTINN